MPPTIVPKPPKPPKLPTKPPKPSEEWAWASTPRGAPDAALSLERATRYSESDLEAAVRELGCVHDAASKADALAALRERHAGATVRYVDDSVDDLRVAQLRGPPEHSAREAGAPRG